MAENRTMEELLQAPTEGYGEAIVIPKINADHFEIKTNLLQLVQANPFHGFERENPHTHIKNFKRITSTLKFKGVLNDVIKLMMFPYSLEGATRVWYNKEPSNSILTWDDLVNKFNDQDSLNAAAGGNLLSKTTREALNITENKLKVRYSRNKPNVSRVNTNSRESSSKTDERIDKLADQISTIVKIVTKKVVTPAKVKAVEESCITCGDAHAYYNCNATDSNQSSFCAAMGTYNQVAPLNRASNQMAPPGFAPMQNSQNSFADALLLMPKFTSTIKSLLTNKDKLFELAKIPLNENCSAMLLKKLPKKLGDPGKFLIPCDFSGMDVCHALADLGASINLMPLSIWKKLSLPELTPTRMTLELADRSITRPKGVTEDVFVKVWKFHFPTDFVVVDFDADPRVPLILERSFLRTGRALIDVYEGELILRDGDEQLIFHVDSTSKLPQKHANESINMINFINVTCEDSFEEVLRLKKSNHPLSGSTTPLSDSRPSLTSFETNDSLLEEFADKLVLLDSFPLGNEDVDFEADLREIELFINEPALVCLPPPGDDDDDKGCDLPFCDNKMIFSNPVFGFNEDFTSSDDESFLKEDVQEENFQVYSNPFFEFDDNYNSSNINPLFNEILEDVESKDSNDSNSDEPVLLNTPLFDED
ncbi:reverse transcriptase domain-containing protein [Tanacetum coccineum]